MSHTFSPATCKGCGKSFKRMSGTQKYCGSPLVAGTCAHQHRLERDREMKRQKRRFLQQIKTRRLDVCGKIHLPSLALVHQNYPLCLDCGRKYLPKLGCLFCKHAKIQVTNNIIQYGHVKEDQTSC